MRWLADECVDAGLVRELRAVGHDVAYVAEIAAGVTDTEVLARAQGENRLLLTEDKDFGELIFRSKRRVPGLVLLRIEPERREIKRQRLEFAIQRLGTAMFGRYAVIDENRLRSRPLRL